MNSWPPPFLKVCHYFLGVRNDDFDPTPSLLFARCFPFAVFFLRRLSLRNNRIKKLIWQKLFGGSNNLGFDIFPDPVNHFGLSQHAGFLKNILFDLRYGILSHKMKLLIKVDSQVNAFQKYHSCFIFTNKSGALIQPVPSTQF